MNASECKWKAGDEMNRKCTPASCRGERILKDARCKSKLQIRDGIENIIAFYTIEAKVILH
jgi:hypothetical protein